MRHILAVPLLLTLVVTACTGNPSRHPPSAAHQSSNQASSSNQDRCRFATVTEVAVASGMPITASLSIENGPDGQGHPGCYYTDTAVLDNVHSAVFVGLYGNDWDAHIARGEADPQGVVHDVPNLGQRALYVTVTGQEDGELFVKVDSAHGFAVKLSSATDNPQQREIAVANLVLPRIQNG